MSEFTSPHVHYPPRGCAAPQFDLTLPLILTINLIFMRHRYKRVASKFGLLALFLATFVQFTMAQTTVTVGTPSGTSGFSPINSCYDYTYSQQIYTAAEITAAGGNVGEISVIRFFWDNGGAPIADWQDWVVYLGNTTQSEFADLDDWIPVGSLTQVFDGVITGTEGGWIDIVLPVPFIYTGDNLVIAIDENTVGWNCTAQWASYSDVAVSGFRAITYRQDGFNPDPAAPPTAIQSSATDRAVLQFDFDCLTTLTPPATVDENICAGSTATFTGNEPYGTVNWYDDMMNLLSTGPTYTTGALGATTTFNATTTVPGCPGESAPVAVMANVVAVDVTLDPVDETCVGNADGTFAVGSVTCGTAPFTYSVDGGAYGPAPTNLTAGTYSVVVQDNLGGLSGAIPVTIVATSSVAPTAPMVTSPIEECSGAASIPLQATGIGNMVTYSIVMDDSFGDGWNGASVDLLSDGNVVSTAGTGFTGGGTATETFMILEGTTLTTSWNTGAYDGECSYEIFDENGVSVGTSSGGSEITPYALPASANVVTWYDMATGGTVQGTGNPLEAIGTLVMPTATSGTYDFWVTQSNGCESTATQLTVNISEVLVDITPQDESCIGYADGTFSVSGVTCGTAPFIYSVDGGAFGPAPTDLTAGTYSVVVEDNLGAQSSPVSVVIGSASTLIPNTPVAVDSIVYACTGDASILVDAPGTALSADSLLTTMAAGNGFDGNMFSITATNPVVITGFAINANPGVGDYEIWYRPDDYLLTAGTNTSNAGWIQVGTVAGINSTVGTYTVIPIPVSVNIPAGMTYSFHVSQLNGPGVAYTDGPNGLGAAFASDANITFNEGHGGSLFNCTNAPRVFNGMIYYDVDNNVNTVWYDAPTAGNQEGTGNPFETVGTTVLPTAVDGTYQFYAASELNGCFSVDRELVTVEVAPVNVDLDPIAADCNNAPTGSFVLANVDCGMAPFTYSVDGGAFGPIPTDLLPGVHSVVVQDANTDLSATIYIVVDDAPAPFGLIMVDITDQGGQVSWNAGATETAWNVEWGLPGFTPGTGAEIGSANALDTFQIITGLDGNTTYDIWVSADCGAGTTTGSWEMITFTTDCGIYTLPFFETFEDNSETRVCWLNNYEVGTADWTYATGSSGGVVTTAYEGTLNAQFVSINGTDDPITKLVSPRFDFSGQDSVALVYAFAQENWAGDQNVTKVYVNGPNSPWVEIQSHNNDVNEWTVDTLFISDTTFQVAFEGINNWGRANVIDDVQFLPCNLNPGIDGATDFCRFDDSLDLNSLITKGETFGRWVFPANQTFITNDSIAQVGLLPTGTHEFYYIVETPCAVDTTVAAITVFDGSSAGTDGTINVCQNEPVDLLSGLGGNVDLGGQWYDPQNNPTPSAITASGLPASYNYDYITSNGVCPEDTANVIVVVSPDCDYLNINELTFGNMTLYPNPTSSSVYITNSGSAEVFDYELTDVNGKVISAHEAAINGTETTEVSLAKLESGFYLIRVFNENAEKTFRIVKE